MRRTGITQRSTAPGDVSLGGKLALVSGDHGPFGLAVQPVITIATGSGTLGIDRTVKKRLAATVEYGLFRDEDPAFARTKHLLTTSVGSMATPVLQQNAGSGADLTADSPHAKLVVGLARHLH